MPTSQCRICTKRYREFKIQVTPRLTPVRHRRLPTCSKPFRIIYGGEWGPVTFPAFKAGDSSLRGWNGGFDFHAPPPNYSVLNRLKSMTECRVPRTGQRAPESVSAWCVGKPPTWVPGAKLPRTPFIKQLKSFFVSIAPDRRKA